MACRYVKIVVIIVAFATKRLMIWYAHYTLLPFLQRLTSPGNHDRYSREVRIYWVRTNYSGDESYHSECFRCRMCQKKIEDLVFAKTSQGIYCIACHNGRMAKNRKSKNARVAAALPTVNPMEKTLPSVPISQRPPEGSITMHDDAVRTFLNHVFVD